MDLHLSDEATIYIYMENIIIALYSALNIGLIDGNGIEASCPPKIAVDAIFSSLLRRAINAQYLELNYLISAKCY